MNRITISGCSRNSIVAVVLALALVLASSRTGMAGPISFSTFVQSTDIATAVGQTNVIGFTYAGNKFVGSLYFGANNFQLYSTNLSGGNVQAFGSPMPAGPGGETVLGASLGRGGFASGDIYASPGGSDQIYHYANSGGAPTLFATTLDGSTVRQIFFDPGSSFGGNMLVTTTAGHIYQIASNGMMSLVASTGEDTEGMDIAPSTWGKYAGDLMVASEGSGNLRFITPGGSVTYTGISVPSAETVSFVPSNLDPSNPLEGFYVADYFYDIQFAPAIQFTSNNLQGHAIITSEDGSNARVWDLTYDSNTDTFSLNGVIGNLPHQSEDGIFVTGQRISDLSTPEPASLLLLGQGAVALLGFAWRERRKRRTAAA